MAALYSDLNGKSVLITGGAMGIGQEIVRHFAAQNCRVAFLDLAVEPGEALAKETGAAFIACDLTDIAALRAAIARARSLIGPIAVLVNNAAHDQRHATPEVTPEYFDDRIAVNVKHQFFAIQAVLDDMKALGGGSIVNFGSTSWMIGAGGMAVYTMAKSAVLGLTRSIARDYGPDNIRCNAIAPGWIMTDRQKQLWLTPEGEETLMRQQCLKRKLQPAEIARWVVFLASDEASAATAQQYVVDGGWA